MKPHGRGRSFRVMSEQASTSSGTPPDLSSIPKSSSEKGSGAEPDPPRRGLGRGSLLSLTQSSVVYKESQYKGKSAIETITEQCREMHIEEKQDVPSSRKEKKPAVDRPSPVERKFPLEWPAPKDRKPSVPKERKPSEVKKAERVSSTEKLPCMEGSASRDRKPSAEKKPASLGSTEKLSYMESSAPKDRKPSAKKKAASSTYTEKFSYVESSDPKDGKPSAGKKPASLGSTEKLSYVESSAPKDRKPSAKKKAASSTYTEKFSYVESSDPKDGKPSAGKKPASLSSTEKLSYVESSDPKDGKPSAGKKPASLSSTEKLSYMGSSASIAEKSENKTSMTLQTNYVKVRTDPDIIVYEYEVTFSPDVEFINFRYRFLYEHFRGKKDILCYDGSAKLFTPERITDDVEEFISRHPVNESEVIMKVKLKRNAEAKDCAVVYNTLFHNCSRLLKLTRFGSKYFDSEEAVDIPQYKLEIWPGYVTAIDEFDGGILLRCDINHRVLRTETVLDVLLNFGRRGPENIKPMASSELIGQCVLTRYNNSLYRIDDIDWSKSPSSTFTLNSGEEITFVQYYKRQYNIEIKDVKQPLLINRAKDKRGGKRKLICLVPEICYMTGLNDKMRKDMKVMKDIARYTRVTPSQRIYAFKKFLANIRNNEEVQKMLKKWGLRVVDELVEVKAKNLEPETLLFGNQVTVKPINSDWMRSLRSMSVYRSVDITSWGIFCPARCFQVANEFTNMIKRMGPGLGIMIADPIKVSLRDDRIETYINSLRENIKPQTQIVVCICPTAREDRYNAIKKFCCKEIPIPSQVVNMTTISREDRMRAVVQNIALQMNHKIGGAGWAIQMPFNRTMVCGVDTYHDKLRSSGSVGAFVATTNDDCTEWFSKTNFQGPKEEFISGIVCAFTSALRTFRQKNGAFPDRIVVFRDGVSDGELDICLNFEVAQFLRAFKIAKYDYRPEFVFIIVQKRISTKLYKVVGRDVENPPPGGVADSVITKKDYTDFYLVSQLVRNGTASPTHYIVLYNNGKATLDYLQRFTYKFCHLYYNWPGTIRVPAPCQYAHKLAYLVGQNIRCEPDESLENKLYYL